MENASKALVIAGGVIIAVMTVAALLYAAHTWGIIPQKKEETDAMKQLSAFNQEYESYIRDGVYGTDLISVLNKARDNNYKYNVKPGERMYVDVKFELKTPVDTVINRYKVYKTGENAGKRVDEGTEYNSANSIRAGTYSLSVNEAFIKSFISKAMGSKKTTKKEEHTDYIAYKEETIAASEFKVRIFKCEDYEYDDEGRIKYLYFVES